MKKLDKNSIKTLQDLYNTGNFKEFNRSMREYSNGARLPTIWPISRYADMCAEILDSHISRHQKSLLRIHDDVRKSEREIRRAAKTMRSNVDYPIKPEEFNIIEKNYKHYQRLVREYNKDNRYLVTWDSPPGFNEKSRYVFLKTEKDVSNHFIKEFNLKIECKSQSVEKS